ncbi:hypothetical protein cand_013040 [Cryptosporidium andersoni]|uniref:EF-hand domain-containing protein n=1 Tax=Cryptosporidium andersoni TaxID=117008 RepID=A0A1J4MDM8_9CRYT|nr:hypothetical protein cand_013040 [Cryptosporidium andersoni]
MSTLIRRNLESSIQGLFFQFLSLHLKKQNNNINLDICSIIEGDQVYSKQINESKEKNKQRYQQDEITISKHTRNVEEVEQPSQIVEVRVKDESEKVQYSESIEQGRGCLSSEIGVSRCFEIYRGNGIVGASCEDRPNLTIIDDNIKVPNTRVKLLEAELYRICDLYGRKQGLEVYIDWKIWESQVIKALGLSIFCSKTLANVIFSAYHRDYRSCMSILCKTIEDLGDRDSGKINMELSEENITSVSLPKCSDSSVSGKNNVNILDKKSNIYNCEVEYKQPPNSGNLCRSSIIWFLCHKHGFELNDPSINYFRLLSYLSSSSKFILPGSFRPLLYELISRHLALKFLEDDKIFKELYVNTIIVRIYYDLDLIDLQKLRLKDIRNSDLITLLAEMVGSESFHDLQHYFNYQHFYVLYCRFIELDIDEDQVLSYKEFRNHDFGALTNKTCARLWDCKISNKKSLFDQTTGNRTESVNSLMISDYQVSILKNFDTVNTTFNKEFYMKYEDFIYFYISDEDKTSERSIRYWFEIVDLDCNGWITPREIEYFYQEQYQRSYELRHTLPELNGILCMMNDLLMPKRPGGFRLDDFQKNKTVAGHFFNILVNTKKCLSTIFKDGEFNNIHNYFESKVCPKYYTPWELHCQYQYQIIQDEDERLQQESVT